MLDKISPGLRQSRSGRLSRSPLEPSQDIKLKRQFGQRERTVARTAQPLFASASRRLDEVIERHCPDLWRSFAANRPVRFEVVSEPISMDAHRAWQSCLVISELVRAAIRRKLATSDHNAVAIELRQLAGHVLCLVAGGGEVKASSQTSTDLRRVTQLVAELCGTFHRATGANGDAFLLTFPLIDTRPPGAEH